MRRFYYNSKRYLQLLQGISITSKKNLVLSINIVSRPLICFCVTFAQYISPLQENKGIIQVYY